MRSKKIRGATNNSTSAIEHFGNRIMRLAGTAMIFNLFRHGFLNLRHAIGNLIHHDDMLNQSLNNIKANLLTAFCSYLVCLFACNTSTWTSVIVGIGFDRKRCVCIVRKNNYSKSKKWRKVYMRAVKQQRNSKQI